MRTVKLTIAYDGTRFVGWQRQASGESIQGWLEQVLGRLEGTPVTVHGAGRTDAGVHALGQVASVSLAGTHDSATLVRALNAQLPPDIRVRTAEDVTPEFHARFSARRKTYRYLVRHAPFADPFERTFAWHVPEPLLLGDMVAAAAALEGTHDFSAFRSTGSDVTTTVRTIYRSELRRGSGGAVVPDTDSGGVLLAYDVEGDGFLRHMVRAIVGTLVEVGRGARTVESVAALLQAGAARAEAGATAPAHGLYLVGVAYD
jgi:tRNA pseudouridine38-40 synthase